MTPQEVVQGIRTVGEEGSSKEAVCDEDLKRLALRERYEFHLKQGDGQV